MKQEQVCIKCGVTETCAASQVEHVEVSGESVYPGDGSVMLILVIRVTARGTWVFESWSDDWYGPASSWWPHKRQIVTLRGVDVDGVFIDMSEDESLYERVLTSGPIRDAANRAACQCAAAFRKARLKRAFHKYAYGLLKSKDQQP